MTNMLDTHTTLMGLTFREVLQKMGEILPPQAYKEITGQGVDLTDIDPSYLTPVVIECFGMPGVGWWYEYDVNSIIHTKEIVTYVKSGQEKERTVYAVSIPKLSLYYRYADQDGNVQVSDPVVSTGGSENRNMSYAMKGAVTNALSQVFTKMLWQLLVYQNKLTHKNAAEMYKKQLSASASKSNGNDPEVSKTPVAKSPEPTPTPTPKPAPAPAPISGAVKPEPTPDPDPATEEIPEDFDRTKRGEEPVYSLEFAKKMVIPAEAGSALAGKPLGEAAKDATLGPSVLNYLAGYVKKGNGEMFVPGDDEKLQLLQKCAIVIMESGEVKDLRRKSRSKN